jgi:hypothetical protein
MRVPRMDHSLNGCEIKGPFSSEGGRYNQHCGQFMFDPTSKLSEFEQIINT